MDINNIDPKVAVEVLCIVSYMDEDLVKIIDKELVYELEKIKDTTYIFDIDKDIPLYDNKFLDGTYEVLKYLFK